MAVLKAYPYPQQASIVTSPVADGISKLQAVGIDPVRILDVYLDAQAYAQIASTRAKQGKESIANPYRYISKVNGMTTDQLKVTNAVLERTYNDVNICPVKKKKKVVSRLVCIRQA